MLGVSFTRENTLINIKLKKLMDAGAVSSRREQYYTMYSINKEVFQCRILDILGEKSSDAQRQQEREARYRQRVLDGFFEYGRLKSIPAQRKKERICLEEIAKELELGRPYPSGSSTRCCCASTRTTAPCAGI